MASRGEPTLHPDLKKMLEYCKGKFLEFKINSNATKLSDDLIHSILDNDVTSMVFSIDSYTKENFERIRQGGIFEEILRNIKQFKKIRDEQYPNSKCVTRISGVKVDSEQDPIKFKEFWKEHVDEVGMVEMENRWDTYHNPKEVMGNGPCNFLWERMYIWYDGVCNPCDSDYKSELKIGSILNKSIEELWNSEEYQSIRKTHMTGERNLCLAGGVALNCVGNGKILKGGVFDNIWIQPAAGDAGGALGAALDVYHRYLDQPREVNGQRDLQQSSLLGPEFDQDEIKAFLSSHHYKFAHLIDEELFSSVAKLIAEQKIIGWFQGRMEFGPRALGNRSILGDPR